MGPLPLGRAVEGREDRRETPGVSPPAPCLQAAVVGVRGDRRETPRVSLPAAVTKQVCGRLRGLAVDYRCRAGLQEIPGSRRRLLSS